MSQSFARPATTSSTRSRLSSGGRTPPNTFAELEHHDLQLAKTASRSTLGFMTEMAFELGWIITDKGGLRRCDINDLNHALHRMLWNRGDYVRPIELVNQRLEARR
jgi:hypothetical protein